MFARDEIQEHTATSPEARPDAAPTRLPENDYTTSPTLDRLAHVAAWALHAPTALIAITVADSPYVVAGAGLPEPWGSTHRIPLAHAFGTAVMAMTMPVIVDDVRADPLLQQHHATTDPDMGAYVGVPILRADGRARSSLCVLDRVPHHWTPDDLAALREIAVLVADDLERQETERTQAQDALALQICMAELALINRQLPLVFWTTDTELRITSLYGTGLPDLPSDPAPFIGQPVNLYVATMGAPDSLVQRSLDAHRQALAGKPYAYQRELAGQTAAVQVEPLRDCAGRIIGCLGGILPLTAPIRLLHELQASRDRLQTLSTQLLHTQEAERRAIARELHDEIGQELTIIQMNVQDLPDVDRTTLPARVEDTLVLVEHVLAQVRDMALNLRPSQLDDLGLVETLRWYLERQVARGHLEITLDLPPLIPRSPPDVETTCFRIVQEAITNILRSADATRVWISVALDQAGLTLTVRDNGRGFDVPAARARAIGGSSLGLLGMEERTALIGGHVTIESSPGQGTVVRAWLPLAAPGADGNA